MRFAIALFCVVAAAIAQADRLLVIPTGKKLPQGTIHARYVFDGADRSVDRYLLAAGVTKSIEIEVNSFARRNAPGRYDTLAITYSFLDPITDILPGLAIGIDDVTNASPGGRALFIATVFRIGLDGDYNWMTPMEVTLGAGTQPFQGAFVGVMVPFTDRLRLIGEHDSRVLRGAVRYFVLPGVGVTWAHQDGASTWSVSWTRRL